MEKGIMSEKKTGFITITYKLRLYDRHHNWLINTKRIYNQVVWHYYQILIQESSFLEQSNFLLLRTLEEVTVGTKEMKNRGEEPIWKLEEKPKIPLYFRRAAINTAIGLARSYETSLKNWRENLKRGNGSIGIPSQARTVDCSPILYKGMYREFCDNSIELKVFNGEKWVWVKYPYTGRKIPMEGKTLSPTLKVERKDAYLHVPIERKIEELYNLKDYMRQEQKIGAVAFPDSNTLAVCVIMKTNGTVSDNCFIYGGKEREYRRKIILDRLEKSKRSRRTKKESCEKQENGQVRNKENVVHYKKLEQINQYYAHKVSREILEYCQKKQVKVIVVPNYEYVIPLSRFQYLNTNLYRWQGRVIILNLKYKAYQKGILVVTVRPYHISDCCSECGSKIQRYNEGHKASQNYYGGKLFFCPNGHRGNTALNTAKNIGRYFLGYFQDESLLVQNE